MTNKSEVEVGLEAESHGMVQLFEVPLQWIPGLHHDLLQWLYITQVDSISNEQTSYKKSFLLNLKIQSKININKVKRKKIIND